MRSSILFVLLLACAALSGCGAPFSSNPFISEGGASAVGHSGSAGSIGLVRATGGAPHVSLETGGADPGGAGGAQPSATGGVPSIGGTSSSGGASAGAPTGGATNTGGASTGGTTSSGGATSTGGGSTGGTPGSGGGTSGCLTLPMSTTYTVRENDCVVILFSADQSWRTSVSIVAVSGAMPLPFTYTNCARKGTASFAAVNVAVSVPVDPTCSLSLHLGGSDGSATLRWQ